MDAQLQSLSGVIDQADDKLRSGVSAGAAVWSTGFTALDRHLGGGFRAGELVLLAGPQGLGKTTLALQALRNMAATGSAVLYFSFEHDAQRVLERLICLEMPSPSFLGGPPATLQEVRAAFDGRGGAARSLVERIAAITGGLDALEAVRSYADLLHVHRSSGSATSLAVIRDVIGQVWVETGERPMVVIDHLQKVHVPGPATVEDERAAVIANGLKDLALDLSLPVLSIVGADTEGLAGGKRMRVEHLRGAAALASEADIILIMNEKFDIVARHHLMYDLANAERFRDWAVVSIEKNRNGKDKVDLEFRKRFEQSRFEGMGQAVDEQLVDERVFVE